MKFSYVNKKNSATKMCTSMNFVKNRRRGQAGDDTFLQMHIFVKSFCLHFCATKKCLNLLCIFFYFFRAGDFSKKIRDNTFFLWGGIGLTLLSKEL